MNGEMSNFDFRDYEEEGLPNRFPEWCLGYGLWRGFIENPNYEAFNLLRSEGTELKRQKPLSCPRVFVSHRQSDTAYAERIAYLAYKEKFYYWLDVHDPALQYANRITLNPYQKSLLIGGIIEMALINCTHVLAVMTPKSQGSMWVPYEYGRIVDLPTDSGRASCWLHPDMGYVPEYLYFGRTNYSEYHIQEWFGSEYEKFKEKHTLNHCFPSWPNGRDEPAILDETYKKDKKS